MLLTDGTVKAAEDIDATALYDHFAMDGYLMTAGVIKTRPIFSTTAEIYHRLRVSTEPANMEHLDQPLFLLGHGIENPADGIHGDEEYLYVVELPTENPFDEPAAWTVKVSGHAAFPRWGGPSEEAFERASWQLHGPLADARAELLDESA